MNQIIKEQETIIGSLAIEQARKVEGLDIADINHIKINGDGKEILADLVERYSQLFGQVSVEVCKETVRASKISKEDLPTILQ